MHLNPGGEVEVSSLTRRCMVEGREVACFNTGDLGHWQGESLICDGEDLVYVIFELVSFGSYFNIPIVPHT